LVVEFGRKKRFPKENMLNIRWLVISLFAGIGLSTFAAAAPHRVILQGNDRLAILAGDGRIEWEMPWGAIHDIHVMENGNIMVQRGPAAVVEIDPRTKQLVWAYDSATSHGNQNTPLEVHSFQPLPDGRVLIAESGAGRLIEIDREGRLTNEVKLKIDKPHVHHDTRLARKLANGNYLVCHEADGAVREYAGPSGEVVWEYEVPLFGRERRDGHGPEAFGNQVFAALRLENGNTLISTGNGHSVLEVTPRMEIAWRLEQHDLPGIVLAWVTTLEVLPSGNYVLGNCHAGPGNPLLVEIQPKTKGVVWTLERFEDFGNSVSNSQLLDVPRRGRR
jgi:outer membrane protein assembly factor BamB